jgi:hypothetical protein
MTRRSRKPDFTANRACVTLGPRHSQPVCALLPEAVMRLREFRLLSAPVTLAAPVSLLSKATVPVPPRNKRVTVARRLPGAKLLR